MYSAVKACMSLPQQLGAGLEQLALALTPEQQRKLLDYIQLIAKWNKVYNLTAVREPEAMVSQHLLDSLSVLPHMGQPRHLLDVGSGAGLPGIPLAIAQPEWRVTLLDSVHKKSTFQRQAVAELGLANVEVACERVEAWRPAQPFDAIISRAFSELKEFARLSAHLLRKGGKLYAMKGIHPHEELAQLSGSAGTQTMRVEEIIPLQVPGLDAERCLIRMSVEEA